MLTQSAVLATLGDGATADGLGALLCSSSLFSNGPIGLSDGRLRRAALLRRGWRFRASAVPAGGSHERRTLRIVRLTIRSDKYAFYCFGFFGARFFGAT